MNNSIRIWLDVAESDLRSSRLLYSNKHYRTSYFFFQQAVEKANKSFALFNDGLEEKEFKKIGHNSLKINRKEIDKQLKDIKKITKQLESFPSVKNHNVYKIQNIPNYQYGLREALNFINNSKDYDLVYIEESEIDELLKRLKEIQNVTICFPDNSEEIFRSKLIEITDWISEFKTDKALMSREEYLELINNKELFHQFLDDLENEILPFIIDFTIVQLTLYFLSILTIQHLSLSRYPDKEINPDTIYTIGLPLVQKQPELMTLLEKAIELIKELILLQREKQKV